MLKPGERFPGFRARHPDTGRPALYLPDVPTILEVKHEFSHWLDYKKLGVEIYANLSTLEKEQMVLLTFRTILTEYSGLIRTLIPIQVEHQFA